MIFGQQYPPTSMSMSGNRKENSRRVYGDTCGRQRYWGKRSMASSKPILLVEMGQEGAPSAWGVLSELGVAGRIIRRPSGEEALAYLQENHVEKPAAIFLDGFEPDANGLNLLRTLKSSERFKSIPLIVLASTAEDPAAIDECYRIGIAGYIAKSSNRSELIDAVRAVHEYWTLSELPVCT